MRHSFEVAKLSGAGNDFVVLDTESRAALGDQFENWVRKICRRGLSLGADGVLVVETTKDGVQVEFFNPDGSTAFCGNGTRCAARWAHVLGVSSPMKLDTAVGEVLAEIVDSTVTLELPFRPSAVRRSVHVEGQRQFDGYDVEAGVPHFVLFVEDVEKAALSVWGPQLRRHPDFGEQGRNIDLLSAHENTWALRTWERGVEAETLACGSGAIAAAAALEMRGERGPFVLVPAGGIPLTVEFRMAGATQLTGEARLLWRGNLAVTATEWS